jgi:hypothetical protein
MDQAKSKCKQAYQVKLLTLLVHFQYRGLSWSMGSRVLSLGSLTVLKTLKRLFIYSFPCNSSRLKTKNQTLTLPPFIARAATRKGICNNEHRVQFWKVSMDDTVVASLPIYLSTALVPNVQLYQYPLLQRPLQAPPSAKTAGKKINARFKPETDVIEIHVPFDTREDVWNKKQGREYGQHRAEEDGQRAISKEERRLDDLRLKSERIREGAAYMVGVIRNSKLYLLLRSRIV